MHSVPGTASVTPASPSCPGRQRSGAGRGFFPRSGRRGVNEVGPPPALRDSVSGEGSEVRQTTGHGLVKRMARGTLTAAPGYGRPKADIKTLGKRATLPYLSGVRKEHVYRRRRIGALFVAAVLAFALYAGSGAGAEQPTVLYTVEPGDTLWSVATEHYPPSEDPRVTVEVIMEANDLPDAQIFPGTRLELPAAS